jgi:hypothetical protein
MPRFNPVSVVIDRRTYTGSYELDDGQLSLGSAYGSATVRPGRSNPDKAARAALQDVVIAWLKAQR